MKIDIIEPTAPPQKQHKRATAFWDTRGYNCNFQATHTVHYCAWCPLVHVLQDAFTDASLRCWENKENCSTRIRGFGILEPANPDQNLQKPKHPEAKTPKPEIVLLNINFHQLFFVKLRSFPEFLLSLLFIHRFEPSKAGFSIS